MSEGNVAQNMRREWSSRINSLFGPVTPIRASWKNINDIAAVLNTMVYEPPGYLNQIVLPSSGSDEFQGASISERFEGCLELNLGKNGSLFRVVNPIQLTCEIIKVPFHMSYFYLECSEIEPTGRSAPYQYDGEIEVFVRTSNGTLIAENDYETKYNQMIDGGDETLQPATDPVTVVVVSLKGSYILVSKFSIYNQKGLAICEPSAGAALEARHQNLGKDSLREYMNQLSMQYRVVGAACVADLCRKLVG